MPESVWCARSTGPTLVLAVWCARSVVTFPPGSFPVQPTELCVPDVVWHPPCAAVIEIVSPLHICASDGPSAAAPPRALDPVPLRGIAQPLVSCAYANRAFCMRVSFVSRIVLSRVSGAPYMSAACARRASQPAGRSAARLAPCRLQCHGTAVCAVVSARRNLNVRPVHRAELAPVCWPADCRVPTYHVI